jgi:(S)-3,5-dihydroxyphenylglycine transaminase
MNFLNEVSIDYPSAISFASGRPAEAFFQLESWLGRIDDFLEHRAKKDGVSPATARALLAQYGRTGGMIVDLVADQIRRDERIRCRPEQVMITAGCQEALALCIGTLFRTPRDVLLVRSPTYIGATGIADASGVEIAALSDLAELEDTIAALERAGKRPRALYLIPEFDNPTGTVIPEGERERILRVCASKRIVILEDNPYGMFRFEGEPSRPLFSLDTHGAVIYLGTYSKTLCPALRVGFLVLPPALFGDARAARELHARLSERKSFVTVNTSQIMQALVGGVLLAEGGTLSRVIEPARLLYGKNRDVMLGSLASCLSESRWNVPSGGFFLTVDLPFAFGRREVERCAAEEEVLVMPLSFFALGEGGERSVRLAFSNVATADIPRGIERFARFVQKRLAA